MRRFCGRQRPFTAKDAKITTENRKTFAADERRWSLMRKKISRELKLRLAFGTAIPGRVLAPSRQAFGCGNQFKQLGWRHGQAIGDPDDAFKGNGAFSAFDPADLVGLIVAKLRQPLLGEVAALPQLSQLFAEQNQCV